jgi:diacylglycerol kinase (ATP)
MKPNESTEARGFSTGARVRSFAYAARGVRTMVVSQHNAWIHAVATLSVVGGGAIVGLERIEWIALVLAIVSVWTAEALNTSLEFLCDVASPDFHPLIEKAKDVAAGGVLICAVGATAVGAFVFVPHLGAGSPLGENPGSTSSLTRPGISLAAGPLRALGDTPR